MRIAFPPPLRAGDVVRVVAPSSPVPLGEFWRGLAWVRDRYRVRMHRDVLARDAFLAGGDATRAEALAAAMTDPDAKAILCARGGYGVTRILDALPWGEFARAPRWIVGFSDVTALHAVAFSHGIASVHAPNVTGLRAVDPWLRSRFLAALERPHAPSVWPGLQVIVPGDAEGALYGGNLALLEALAAAGRLAVPEGALLVLEDVTERPYRIDRMLTSLRMGGHLARAGAIVLGEFTQCDAGPDGRAAFDVLVERTRDLGIPVVAGAPVGHGKRNDAFVHGAAARLRGATLTIAPP